MQQIQIVKLDSDCPRSVALQWYTDTVRAIGQGFHPDTPARDYIHVETRAPLFDAASASALDTNLELCAGLFDLYDEAITALGLHDMSGCNCAACDPDGVYE